MSAQPADDVAIDRFYAEVGRRIRAARGKRTQAQIAVVLGMTRSSIANLEAGRQRIPLHLLVLISEITQTPVTELLPKESMLESDGFFSGIDLDDISESNRDFIEGAMAQLKLGQGGDSGTAES